MIDHDTIVLPTREGTRTLKQWWAGDDTWVDPDTGDLVTTTYWVCYDCLATTANGTEHPRPDDAAEFLGQERNGIITMGILGHHEDCEDRDPETGTGLGNGHCECDTRGSAKSRCDGCRTPDHGERFAFTYWYEKGDQ